jgi:hypothetical protein
MQMIRKVGKGHRIRCYGGVVSQLLDLASPKVRNQNGCNMKNISHCNE